MTVAPRLVRNQPDMKADGGVPLMVEPGAVSFVDALHGRVADILDFVHAMRQVCRGVPDGRAGGDRFGR